MERSITLSWVTWLPLQQIKSSDYKPANSAAEWSNKKKVKQKNKQQINIQIRYNIAYSGA